MTNQELLDQVKGFESRLPNDPPVNDKKLLVLYDMVQTVKGQSENYQNPQAISTIPVDVRSILKRETVDPDHWVKVKGNYMRSEAESVQWLIAELTAYYNQNSDADQAARNKARAKAKAKIRIKMLTLKMI